MGIFNFFSKQKKEDINYEEKLKLLRRVKRLILICDILIGKLVHKESVKENLYKSAIERAKNQVELTKSHLEGVYKSLEELNLSNINLIIEELEETLNSIRSHKNAFHNTLIKYLTNIKKFNRDDKNNIVNMREEILNLIKTLNILKNKLDLKQEV